MSRKVTIEDIRDELKENGLVLISTTYEGAYSNIEYFDEYGYKYKQTLSSIKRRNKEKKKYENHTFSPRNIYAFENFKFYMNKEVDSGTELISQSLGSSPYNIKFNCGRCGEDFCQNLKEFINKNPYHVCQDCAKKIQKTRLIDFDEIKKEISKTKFELMEEKTHYSNTKSKIVVRDENGYLGAMPIATILKSKTVSPFAKYNPYVIDNIKKYIDDNNIDCCIEEQSYPGWDYPIKLKCGCKNEFETTLTSFMSGKVQCNDCSKTKSNFEKLVENWLNGNNINYESQKRFKDCVNIRCLPFDFYLKDFNIILEVDGEGHFRPVRFNGSSKENAEKSYISTSNNDEIKNRFCIERNIKLIRIPYWEFNKEDEYINTLNNSVFGVAN